MVNAMIMHRWCACAERKPLLLVLWFMSAQWERPPERKCRTYEEGEQGKTGNNRTNNWTWMNCSCKRCARFEHSKHKYRRRVAHTKLDTIIAKAIVFICSLCITTFKKSLSTFGFWWKFSTSELIVSQI